jgi:GT2 family glycosyltransferase
VLDISFVIVSWNSAKYLVDCIDSIYKTVCGPTFEVIVVDNGSSDGSPQVVRQKFPGVRLVVSSENLGFGKANNIGMVESKGRYICLANSDTVLLDGGAEKLFNFMEDHQDVGLAGPMVLNADRSQQASCRKIPSLWDYAVECFGMNGLFKKGTFFGGQFIRHLPLGVASSVDILSGCFLFARRAAVDMVGMFDERFYIYSEDLDWSMRFHAAGWKVMFNPTSRVIHHGGVSSDLQPVRFYIEMYRSKLLLWGKYHGALSQGLLRLVLFCHHCLRLIGGFAVSSLSRDKETSVLKIKRSRRMLSWLWGEGARIGKKTPHSVSAGSIQ